MHMRTIEQATTYVLHCLLAIGCKARQGTPYTSVSRRPLKAHARKQARIGKERARGKARGKGRKRERRMAQALDPMLGWWLVGGWQQTAGQFTYQRGTNRWIRTDGWVPCGHTHTHTHLTSDEERRARGTGLHFSSELSQTGQH